MMLMKNRSLVLIYTIVLFAAAAALGIAACSGTGISEFYGIMENNPKLSMLLALLSVPVPNERQAFHIILMESRMSEAFIDSIPFSEAAISPALP